MASHPHVDGVVYVCGPQPGREKQQLEGHEVHRDEQQRPAIRQRLQERNTRSEDMSNAAAGLVPYSGQLEGHYRAAADLHDAVQGVEREAGKGAEGVLLVVLVVYVVQGPAGRHLGSSCYQPDACTPLRMTLHLLHQKHLAR